MVTGKAISIARTCPLAKDGLIRAGFRGGKTVTEWGEGNQEGQIGLGPAQASLILNLVMGAQP